MKKLLMGVMAVVIALAWCSGANASTIVFEDDFEGSIKSEWMENHPGAYEINSENVQSGSYSVKSDTYNNTLNLDLESTSISNGTAEAWFYDYAEEAGTHPGISISMETSTGQRKGLGFTVSYLFEPENYSVRTGTHSIVGTGIGRSVGWHIVQFNVSSGNLKVYLDYELIYQTEAANIYYLQLGSSFIPDAGPVYPAYFDDVKVYSGEIEQPPSLEDRIEELEQRVDTLETEQVETNSRLTILEQILQGLEDAVDQMLGYFNNLPKGLKKIIGL